MLESGEKPAVLLKMKLHQPIMGISKARLTDGLIQSSPEVLPLCSLAAGRALHLNILPRAFPPESASSQSPLLQEEHESLGRTGVSLPWSWVLVWTPQGPCPEGALLVVGWGGMVLPIRVPCPGSGTLFPGLRLC